MRYIWESGKPGRVMHIGQYDKVGNFISEALCGIKHTFDRSINAPFGLGRKVCKDCRRILKETT